MTYLALDYSDVALAALLILVNAGLSVAFRLRLERRLLIAATRMVVQLLLVGLVLKALFAAGSPWLTGAVAMIMTLFAAYEIHARQTRPLVGAWSFALGAGSMAFAGFVVTILALTTQIRPEPWYDARYAIPLLGMVVGNAMTGVSLGLDRLFTGAVRERAAIEARLALGQSFAEASSVVVRDAVRAALIPSINAMSAAGVVFLPGMMTGQILAGVDPAQAVKYHLLVMFLIAGGTGLGVVMAVRLGRNRLTDARHRLRLDRLRPVRDA